MKKPTHPKIYSKNQIKKIRAAGDIVARVLAGLSIQCKEGITTKQLDELAAKYIAKWGGISASYQYKGFPGHCSISIDEVLLHGIPSDQVIKNGMLVGIDCPVIYQGMYADGAINVEVGEVSEDKKRLKEVSKKCLYKTLEILKPGVTIREICERQQQYANENGFKVIKDFQGHGVGRNLHEPPAIPYYVKEDNPYNDYKLKVGNVLAIEPGLVTNDVLITTQDGWSVVNEDLSVGTSWEHTVVITEKGYNVLTSVDFKI